MNRNAHFVYTKLAASTSDGLAISSKDKVIYYADTGANVIGVINYDGTGQRNFITTDLSEPRGIAVNADTRYATGYINKNSTYYKKQVTPVTKATQVTPIIK